MRPRLLSLCTSRSENATSFRAGRQYFVENVANTAMRTRGGLIRKNDNLHVLYLTG
jgi:hypothetical protein